MMMMMMQCSPYWVLDIGVRDWRTHQRAVGANCGSSGRRSRGMVAYLAQLSIQELELSGSKNCRFVWLMGHANKEVATIQSPGTHTTCLLEIFGRLCDAAIGPRHDKTPLASAMPYPARLRSVARPAQIVLRSLGGAVAHKKAFQLGRQDGLSSVWPLSGKQGSTSGLRCAMVGCVTGCGETGAGRVWLHSLAYTHI